MCLRKRDRKKDRKKENERGRERRERKRERIKFKVFYMGGSKYFKIFGPGGGPNILGEVQRF